MPKISIIVPVYKTEKYLDRCVESLVCQTLQDIEIIIVDDGSPDNCPEICDAWAKRDSRIKVVHKKNGGLSSARNAGLYVAMGNYIGFVDSDDDVEPNMYEKMMDVAERECVDFVMADYQRILENGKKYLKTLDIDDGRYDKEKIRSDIFPSLIMSESVEYGPLLSVWHCIYCKDFLKKNSLFFDEQVRWSEDNIFSSIIGYKADSFYYMKGVGLYHYYQNPGTITTSYRKGAWNVYCKMNDHLHDFFDKIQDYDFSRQLNLHMIYYMCNCLGQIPLDNGKNSLVEISHILNDEHATNAFRRFRLPTVNFKLWLQLALMKFRWNWALYILLQRRKNHYK